MNIKTFIIQTVDVRDVKRIDHPVGQFVGQLGVFDYPNLLGPSIA